MVIEGLCELLALGPTLLLGLGVLVAVPVLAWPWLGRFRSALVFVSVLAGGLLVSDVRVRAYSPELSAMCQSINDTEWPCWMIEALGCPCTWDDPPPLPPPPG